MTSKIKGDIKLPTNSSSGSPKQPSKTNRKNKSSGTINISANVTTDYEYQEHIRTIGIYDHEWKAIHKFVDKLNKETSKFSIGSALDGFGIGLFLPFFSSLYKIIQKKAIVSDDVVNECLIYFGLIIVYGLLLILRKTHNPKWISTYSDFKSDISNLHDRIDEIEERIGIKKEE